MFLISKNKTLLRAVFTALLCYTTVHASSLIDALLEKQDYKTLGNYIQKATVINHESELPDNASNNDLVIIDNEYDVKIMYEYNDGEWTEKGGEQIAQILNGGEKTTYHHLFNFKLEKEDFNEYTSDKSHFHLEILKSSYKQDELNRTIKEFITAKGLKTSDIINIQIQNITQKDCDIIISYKY